jgi:hypothetical protein
MALNANPKNSNGVKQAWDAKSPLSIAGAIIYIVTLLSKDPKVRVRERDDEGGEEEERGERVPSFHRRGHHLHRRAAQQGPKGESACEGEEGGERGRERELSLCVCQPIEASLREGKERGPKGESVCERGPCSLSLSPCYLFLSHTHSALPTQDRISIYDISSVSGMAEVTIKGAYRDIYPELARLLPKGFTTEEAIRALPPPVLRDGSH